MPNKTTPRTRLLEQVKAGTVEGESLVRKEFICDEIRAVKASDDGTVASRTRQFVISTGNPDRDNDVVEASGWLLENYRKNPVVLWAHDYRSLPIGKATMVGIEGGKLVANAEFADHEMANTVLRLIDGGFLRATSVGFRPTKYVFNEDRRGIDFSEQELLEFSVVPVPANPEALIMSREFASDVEQLKSWAKGIIDIKVADEKEVEPPPAAEETKEPAEPVATEGGISDADVARIADAVAGKLADNLKSIADTVVEGVAAKLASKAPADEPQHACCSGGCTQKAGNQCGDCGHMMCAEHTKNGDSGGNHLCAAHCASKSVSADTVIELADDDDDAVAIEIEEKADGLSTEDISDAIRAAVGGLVGEIVRNETQSTLNRLTGRVD